MYTQLSLLVLWCLGLTTAAVTCDSEKTTICYVRKQKISATESFEVLRSTPFTDLILSNTDMPNLPSTIFTSYPNITFLSGSNNGLKVLSLKNFANAGKLKKLFLSYGNLARISNGTFRNCFSLENLQMTSHKISHVAAQAFQGLTNLHSLSLGNNSIEVLHEDVFSMLPNLNILSLDMNKLKSLSSNIFKANSALFLAVFSENQLVELPQDLFSSSPELQSLNFDKNLLQSARTYGSSFADFSSNQIGRMKVDSGTQTLFINDNLIEKLECESVDLTSFKKVYASNNKLTNFGCIRDMENLTDLDVSDNNFARPTQDVFMKLTQIRDLRMYNQTKFLKVSAKIFSPMRSISALRTDRLIDYRNLRQLFPNLMQISLTTRTWNCSYTQQVAKALSRQAIYMNYNNFRDRSICNINQTV